MAGFGLFQFSLYRVQCSSFSIGIAPLNAGVPPHKVFTPLFRRNVMGSLTHKGCVSP